MEGCAESLQESNSSDLAHDMGKALGLIGQPLQCIVPGWIHFIASARYQAWSALCSI